MFLIHKKAALSQKLCKIETYGKSYTVCCIVKRITGLIDGHFVHSEPKLNWSTVQRYRQPWAVSRW